MSSQIKVVVVGPGLIGKKHISLINDNPLTKLCAIVAPDHSLNHEIALKNNVPIFHDLRECIINTKIDGVIISSPNQFHAEQARICIEARIPVLIEKPITSLLSEGLDLLNLVERNNSQVLIGHHRAHSPIMRKASEIIHGNRLGRLVTVMGSAQFYKPDHYFIDGPWRKEIGGGPILINLIHEIGNLRYLCGEIDSVHAFSSSVIRNFAVEDTVAINLRFKNGVLGTFILSDASSCAKSWEQTSQENPSYPTYSDEDCYLVSGTQGSLAIPNMHLKYYNENTKPSWWSPFESENIEITREDPLKCQLNHFCDIIINNASPLVSAKDGYINLLVTESIRKSAINNQAVKILY